MMKKHILIFTLFIFWIFIFSSCSSSDQEDDDTRTEWECGTHNGNTLYTGPQGGCYYYNSNGNKTYVDRTECNC